jgi:hypothetical protein
MQKSSKINQIALDKTNIFCYNNIMKSNNNNTNTTLIQKGKFNMTYTVKRNTEVLYNGTDLVHAKWRFQLSSQMNQNATLTLRSGNKLLMMHSRRGLVLNELS